jgi:alpha-glucosidase
MLVDGRIGEYCVFARQGRGSDDWYIGGVNGDEPREVTIPLSMLDAKQSYKATLYLDGEQANWQTNPYDYIIEERALCAQDTLRVRMASGGGLAIQLKAQKAQ